MSGNQGSKPERGYQKSYEDAAASIQQHIRRLLDEHARISILLRENRPSAQDDVTRLVQLHATVRPTTQLIKDYVIEYLRADTEWSRIIAQHKLHVDRSAWAQAMLQQRNTFFHGLSLAVTPLDYLFAQLLQDVYRTLEDIEMFIRASPTRDFQPSSTAAQPQCPTPVGTEPRTAPPAGVTNSAAETRSMPPPLGERDPRSNPTTHFSSLPSRNPHPTRSHRNSTFRTDRTTGIMSVTEGNIADAIPLAWIPGHSDELPHATTQASALALPANRPTPFVGNEAAEPPRPPEEPRPRNINPEHRRLLRHVLSTATMPGGKGPSRAPSPTRLQFGADGRPFDHGSASATAATAIPTTDFGEDFARENSSSFYRNANFVQRPSQASAFPPPFPLKETPLPPFSGDIRSYPDFRNRFLELVEAQRNMEPRHKLLYLLQLLQGTPLSFAQGFPLTDESYFDVIEHLERRYGDKNALMNLLIQEIFDLPPPQMKREELQLFHDKAFRNISSLSHLGSGYGPGSTMAQILLGKLPAYLKVKIFEKYDPTTLDANTVLRALRDRISVEERAETTGLTLTLGPREMPTTSWSFPPGNFRQRNPPRAPERPNPRPAPNNHQFYVADFVTSNVTDRTDNVKQNKCLPCLEGDHGRLSCPQSQCPTPVGSQATALVSRATSKTAPPVWGGLTASDAIGRQMDANGRQASAIGASFRTRRARCETSVDRDVPFPREHPTVPRMRSANREAGNSDPATLGRPRKSASTKRTASSRGGTPRLTTLPNESLNPQGAIAFGDDGSLPGHRTTLSADSSSSRTRTACEFSKATSKPKALPKKNGPSKAPKPSARTTGNSGFKATDGSPSIGRPKGAVARAQPFPRSNEETLIHKPKKPQRRRVVQKPPGATSNRFDPDFGSNARHLLSVPTAPPKPVSQLAVLLECVEVLASTPAEESDHRHMRSMRPDGLPLLHGRSGSFQDVIAFFDSGCLRSCVRTSLVKALQLPNHGQRTHRVHTFGTRPPVAVKGIDTTITLWTADYRPITFDVLAMDTIASSVTTALVEETDLPLLRSDYMPIRPLCLTPDILIGQDLVHLFDRQDLQRLPHGFSVVKTNLGIAIGGAGQLSFAPISEAVRPSSSNPTKDLQCPTPVGVSKDPPQPRPLPFSGPVPAGPTRLQTTEASDQVQPFCPLCTLTHDVADCTTFGTADERRQRREELHLCPICFIPFHWPGKCPQRGEVRCQTCRRWNHHHALCRRKTKDTTTLKDPVCTAYVANPRPSVAGCQNPLDITEPLLLTSTSADGAPSTGSASSVEATSDHEETTPQKEPLCATPFVASPRPTAAGCPNPLDTTEPPLLASTSAKETPSTSSTTATEDSSQTPQKTIPSQLRDAAFSVLRTLKSRKTRLRHSSVSSDVQLGCHH